MEISTQGTAFKKALAEPHTGMQSIETGKKDEADPEVIELLKNDVQEARSDANFALEDLKRTRDDADERFGRVAIRLKALEIAAVGGSRGPAVHSSGSEEEQEDPVSRKGRPKKQKKPKKIVWQTRSSKNSNSGESQNVSRSSANDSAEDRPDRLSSEERGYGASKSGGRSSRSKRGLQRPGFVNRKVSRIGISMQSLRISPQCEGRLRRT